MNEQEKEHAKRLAQARAELSKLEFDALRHKAKHGFQLPSLVRRIIKEQNKR